MRSFKWVYGVTTVPDRVNSGLLDQTLTSLTSTGFGHARVFVDGYTERCPLWSGSVVNRGDPIPRCNFGNWYLGLWELYLREPNADRYAMFEDDILCVKGLRAYLESCPYPDGVLGRPPAGYLNLYTYPHNIKRNPDKHGWFPSDQMGKGAVALVFDNPTTKLLLGSKHMVAAVQGVNRSQRSLDGSVARALMAEKVIEYVHNPSLVQHVGFGQSVLRPQENDLPPEKRLPQADTFPGEGFNAMDLRRIWKEERRAAVVG